MKILPAVLQQVNDTPVHDLTGWEHTYKWIYNPSNAGLSIKYGSVAVPFSAGSWLPINSESIISGQAIGNILLLSEEAPAGASNFGLSTNSVGEVSTVENQPTPANSSVNLTAGVVVVRATNSQLNKTTSQVGASWTNPFNQYRQVFIMVNITVEAYTSGTMFATVTWQDAQGTNRTFNVLFYDDNGDPLTQGIAALTDFQAIIPCMQLKNAQTVTIQTDTVTGAFVGTYNFHSKVYET